MADVVDEDLEALRTKLLLVGLMAYEVHIRAGRYALVDALRMPKPLHAFATPNNQFWESEREALEAGYKLVLEGAERWERG